MNTDSTTGVHPGALRELEEEPFPWRRRDGIVKFLEFPVRKAGLSHRAFHLYWQRHHSPHVMNITGFSRYMRKYVSVHGYQMPVAGMPERYRAAPFDGASEIHLNGLDEVLAWLSHPAYAELIQPDEQRFLSQDGQGRVLLTCEERIVSLPPDAAESGLVRVYRWLARRKEVSRDAFHAAVSGAAKAMAASGGGVVPVQITVNHRVEDPLPIELPEPGVNAVLALDFRGLEAALAFLADENADAAWTRAVRDHVTPDSMQLLVARVCVVHDEFSFQATMMQPKPFSWS
jgi:hypothetical protein